MKKSDALFPTTKPTERRARTVEDIGAEARRLGVLDLETLKGAIIVFQACGYEAAVKALKAAKQNGVD